MSSIPKEWLVDEEESKDTSGITDMLVENGEERQETRIINKSKLDESEIDYLIENGQEREETFTYKKQEPSVVKGDVSLVKEKVDVSVVRKTPPPPPQISMQKPSKKLSYKQKSLNSSSSRWVQKKSSVHQKSVVEQKPFSKKSAYDNNSILNQLYDQEEPNMQFTISLCIDRTRLSLKHIQPLKQATHDDILIIPYEQKNFDCPPIPALLTIDRVNIKNYVELQKQQKKQQQIPGLLMNCPSKKFRAFGLVDRRHLATGIKNLLDAIYRIKSHITFKNIIIPYFWPQPAKQRSHQFILSIYDYLQSCQYCQTTLKVCVNNIDAFQHCQEFIFGKILQMGPGSKKNRQ